MAFNWLNDFQREQEKADNYAEKTLAAYRLGMKAGGSIEGVRIQVDEGCCDVCRALDGHSVFHPDEAPRLPPVGCPRGSLCRCVYRPVMSYEVGSGGGE